MDADVPMIETGHAVSEEVGLRLFADRLRTDHPGLPVAFAGPTCPFTHR